MLTAKGLDPVAAGWWASVPILVGLIASVLLPRFATPDRRVTILMCLITAAFVGSVLLVNPPGAVLIGGLLLLGIARGTLHTVALLTLIESKDVPQDRVGMAGGVFFSAAEIGGVLGPLTFGILLEVTGGFTAPIVTLCLISCGLMAICLVLRQPNQGGA